MIYLFSGTPGSGKSLHMARLICDHLQYGYPVIANFPIRMGAIHVKRGKKLQFFEMDNAELEQGPEKLVELLRQVWAGKKVKEGGVWLFLDESQLLFNARSWNMRGRQQWLTFFTQHRKLGVDVFLVAQYSEMLDKQVRALIEYEWLHRKISNIGISGQIISAVCFGGLFICVKYWSPGKMRIGASWFKYHRCYGELYDTMKLFGGNEAAYKLGQADQPLVGAAAVQIMHLPQYGAAAEISLLRMYKRLVWYSV